MNNNDTKNNEENEPIVAIRELPCPFCNKNTKFTLGFSLNTPKPINKIIVCEQPSMLCH